MITFRTFLLEAVREGLPHVSSMSHEQFGNLIKHGSFNMSSVTEKTDGMPHEFGYDEQGFYTRTKPTKELKVRFNNDYKQILADRGVQHAEDKAKTYGHIHELLHTNPKLQSYLHQRFKQTGQDVRVKGEIFYDSEFLPARSSPFPGEKMFVATSYRTDHMGTHGKYIVHTQLPENAGHHIEALKAASSSLLNFDDDKIKYPPTTVKVPGHIAAGFNGINKELISSRTTKTNKEAKTAEIAKFDAIKGQMSNIIDQHFKNIAPKWGSETEGYVVHPTHEGMPRFKVTSQTFRERRAQGPVEWKKQETSND